MMDEWYVACVKGNMGSPSLFFPGSFSEQPEWVLQAWRVISSIYVEEDEKIKETQKHLKLQQDTMTRLTTKPRYD